MDFKDFQTKLAAVKYFEKDGDYEIFETLVDNITGEEGIEWLNCLLDAVCVEDDYGPYESLFNAIWRFPDVMVGRRLGEYLPSFQKRMSFAPFQVSRFYIIIPAKQERIDAFLEAAKQWGEEEYTMGMETILEWCRQREKEEQEWGPTYSKLGGTLPATPPIDPIPNTYHWPQALEERLAVWRTLPPDDTSEKVFWLGGSANAEIWKAELPYIIEALALRHGKKWRDIVVWLNPLSFYAKGLYPKFIEAFTQASDEIRNRALATIQEAQPNMFTMLCKELEEHAIVIEKPNWQA